MPHLEQPEPLTIVHRNIRISLSKSEIKLQDDTRRFENND